MVEPRLEFRVLGPLEVRAGGVVLPIRGPNQRVLLSLLLLSANQPVSRDRLTEVMASGATDHALRIQISRLRKALGPIPDDGPQPRLAATPAGYVLRVEPGELDLDGFEHQRREGHRLLEAGKLEAGVRALRSAEALWRGRALSDVDLDLVARTDTGRLEEVRLSVVEARVDAELALGRHASLIAELDALVLGYPYREHLRGQHMLALYQAGRQADALASFRQARLLLVEQLGIEPGARLRQLEQAILRQDRALDTSAAPAGRLADVAERERRRPWRSRRRAFVAATALVAGLTAVMGASLTLFAKHPAVSATPAARDGLVLVSLDGKHQLARVALGAAATGIASGLGALWLAEGDAGSVERVDLRSRTVRQTIPVGDGPFGVALAAGDVWVANTLDGTVSRIDPSINAVVQIVRVGTQPAAVAPVGRYLWVANRGDGTISRVDPHTGRVTKVIQVGRGPACLAAQLMTLWVCDEDAGTVSRIDTVAGIVDDTIHVGDAPSSIAVTPGDIWVLNRLDSTVSEIDSSSDTIRRTVPINGSPSALAADGSRVWVTNDSTGGVARVNSATSFAAAAGAHTGPLLATRDGLWVALTPSGGGHRGGTLRIMAPSFGAALDNADPAFGSDVGETEFIGLAYDGLVTLDHVSGPDGATLVPDLAESLPMPSDGGRTYVFRLRPGLRYSDGSLVRSRDVRHSIERVFDIASPGMHFYTDIVGAAACTRRFPCNLSHGIVIDEKRGTIVFHLRAPDPDFLYKLTLPYAFVVPTSTPDRDVSSTPPPATGPYVIRPPTAGGTIRLTRNPRFREWSAAAQPRGYPDEVDWLQHLRSSGVTSVERGRADLLLSLGSPADSAQLRLRYPSLLRTNWGAGTEFFFLNTRAKPFDDARVRRALNYAVDRVRIAGFWGGPAAAAPTCQLLPPQIPGYFRYCPYTAHAEPGGSWRSPALARARRLVSVSGTTGMRVRVWGTVEPRGEFEEGRYLARVLRKLGYRASFKALPDQAFFSFANDSRNRAQVVSGGWSADYPSSSDFIGKLSCRYFAPGSPLNTTDASEFCSHAFDKQIASAESLQATDSAAANAAWAQLDREITDRAVLVPTVTFKETDVVGRRAGNYQYQVFWGPIVDQIWVR